MNFNWSYLPDDGKQSLPDAGKIQVESVSANMPYHHEEGLTDSTEPLWNLGRKTLMNLESSVFPGI